MHDKWNYNVRKENIAVNKSALEGINNNLSEKLIGSISEDGDFTYYISPIDGLSYKADYTLGDHSKAISALIAQYKAHPNDDLRSVIDSAVVYLTNNICSPDSELSFLKQKSSEKIYLGDTALAVIALIDYSEAFNVKNDDNKNLYNIIINDINNFKVTILELCEEKMLDEKAPAILNMWMPGTEGGNACARLLFGDVVPSGKITMTFPRTLGQCPIYYNYYTTGRPKLEADDLKRVRFTSSFIDVPNSPLYPFGYGLSYTSFEYSDYTLSNTKMDKDGKLVASVKVKNTGAYKAKEAVQLYIRDVKGSCVRPVKELKGFEKIELDAGEEKTVSFEITEPMLRYFNQKLEHVSEKGEFQVFIGKDSTCKPFASFMLN